MASKFLNLSLDNTLGGNSPSDSIIPSQKAIKYYIDNADLSIKVVSDTNGDLIVGAASNLESE